MTHTFAPIPQYERASILDVLRGFALLGTIITNSAVFSLYVFQAPETLKSFGTAPIDEVLNFLIHVFIEGKFYSIFSLLFGIGFSIIIARNMRKGKNALGIFYRRILILLILGLCHSFLIWDGDILFFYAVLGLILPLFRNLSNKKLLWLTGILLLSPLLFDLLKIISKGTWNLALPFLFKALALSKEYGIEDPYPGNWLIEYNTYSDLLKWTDSGFWYGWFLRMDGNRVVKVLAMFLLGLYLGRNQFYLQLQKHKTTLIMVQKLGLGIGIPAGIAMAWFAGDGKYLPEPAGILDTLFYALNVAPLALAYIATLALWYSKGKFQKVLATLQPVGRMALTNYVMQSLLGILIYYGLGFGLGGKFGPAGYIPIALIVFIFQLVFSHWWLSYLDYGPLEWIWRQLTYWKRLPIVSEKKRSGLSA